MFEESFGVQPAHHFEVSEPVSPGEQQLVGRVRQLVVMQEYLARQEVVGHVLVKQQEGVESQLLLEYWVTDLQVQSND
jgi:hypothetical protein